MTLYYISQILKLCFYQYTCSYIHKWPDMNLGWYEVASYWFWYQLLGIIGNFFQNWLTFSFGLFSYT